MSLLSSLNLQGFHSPQSSLQRARKSCFNLDHSNTQDNKSNRRGHHSSGYAASEGLLPLEKSNRPLHSVCPLLTFSMGGYFYPSSKCGTTSKLNQTGANLDRWTFHSRLVPEMRKGGRKGVPFTLIGYHIHGWWPSF